jgi:hypothetical protein
MVQFRSDWRRFVRHAEGGLCGSMGAILEEAPVPARHQAAKGIAS